jgi:spore coat polysaccharide biosynthesis protein SpsF (cytidylyltransferase family)
VRSGLGDNPLVHADLIDACMKIFRDGDVDYVATVTNEYPLADAELKKFPIGVRVQVLRQSALTRCSELATSASAREHATSFIAAHPEIFPTAFLEASGPFSDCHRPELTFAVNYPGNLELIRALFGRLADERPFFGVGDAIRAFDGDTDLARFMGEPS